MQLDRPHGQMSDSFLMSAFIILSGGLQDAYTYCCRDKVFANAQTGNIVLMSTHLFAGDWADVFRYFVPVISFMAGTMCIGNMRSGTEALCAYFHTHDREVLKKALTYFGVIGIFAVGAGLGSVLTARFAEKGIWVSCLLLAVSFLMMFVREEEKK